MPPCSISLSCSRSLSIPGIATKATRRHLRSGLLDVTPPPRNRSKGEERYDGEHKHESVQRYNWGQVKCSPHESASLKENNREIHTKDCQDAKGNGDPHDWRLNAVISGTGQMFANNSASYKESKQKISSLWTGRGVVSLAAAGSWRPAPDPKAIREIDSVWGQIQRRRLGTDQMRPVSHQHLVELQDVGKSMGRDPEAQQIRRGKQMVGEFAASGAGASKS